MQLTLSSPLGFLQLIFGLACIPVVLYLFSIFFGYLFGGVSKVTGKSISYHGKTSYTPETIDVLNAHVKGNVRFATQVMANLYSKTKRKLSSIENSKIKNAIRADSKIEQLKQLQKLKKEGVINLKELEILKQEIISVNND